MLSTMNSKYISSLWDIFKLEFDSSLFFMKDSVLSIYLLVYADDIIVTGSSPTVVQRVISAFSTRFSVILVTYITFLVLKCYNIQIVYSYHELDILLMYFKRKIC